MKDLAGCIVALLLGISAAHAQPVCKCTMAGKTSYSHEPCRDAQVVDTTPTQGLDKSSGKSRKGADVRAAETNKLLADALKPVFNETPEEREKRHRRYPLPPQAKLECSNLDPQISGASSGMAADALLKARTRYRELRC